MKTIEYRTVDKSQWGDGPWQNEPDKKQWRDPETGLPCLIVRGPAGALCGYVGVSEDHPWYGKEYDNHDLEWDDPERDRLPGSVLRVHGGVTFAGGCHGITEGDYQRMLERVAEHQKMAERYPRGDSAEWLKAWLPHLGSFEAYSKKAEAEFICHKDQANKEVWWFGFDCAHAYDVLPKRKLWRLDPDIPEQEIPGEEYRDMAYVEAQVASLAKQLAAVK